MTQDCALARRNAGNRFPLKEVSRYLRGVFSPGFWALLGLRTGIIKTGTQLVRMKSSFYMSTTSSLTFLKIFERSKEYFATSTP